jgi:ankyrin repeat protein
MHVVKFLFESGANLYVNNDRGETAADAAHRRGHTKIVTFLQNHAGCESLTGCCMFTIHITHIITNLQ